MTNIAPSKFKSPDITRGTPPQPMSGPRSRLASPQHTNNSNLTNRNPFGTPLPNNSLRQQAPQETWVPGQSNNTRNTPNPLRRPNVSAQGASPRLQSPQNPNSQDDELVNDLTKLSAGPSNNQVRRNLRSNS